MQKEAAITRLEREVEEIKSEICDKICKWPELYNGNPDDFISEHCQNCPLNRL